MEQKEHQDEMEHEARELSELELGGRLLHNGAPAA